VQAQSRWLVPLLFFASGASGLVYEVVWVRRFGSLFGSTVYSAALVTGIFVCGLGLGGYLAGRWADRRVDAGPGALLRVYGFFEVGIAALAAGLDRLLPHIAELAAAVASYQLGEYGWYWLAPGASLVRYACAAALLLPITLLMGGTLTLLIRDRVRDDVSGAGWDVSVLYGVNTAGAALGCFLTDTVLVPRLGIHATQLLAVGANLFAGLGALALARTSSVGASRASAPPAPRAPAEPALVSLAASLAFSGFAAMAFQILWFRHLVAFFGGYRPMFSILLTSILIGIWLGALLGGALARRVRRPAALQALALAGFVAASLAGLALAEGSREGLARAAAGSQPWSFYALWLRGAVALVLVPSLCSGAAFPLANALVQRERSRVGTRAGVLYLANSLGCVLGSLAAGFWLLPAVGIQGAAGVAAAAALLGLAALLHATLRLERASRVLAGGAFVATALALAAWQLLPQGWLVQRSLWASVGRGDRVVTVREGVGETIAVVEKPGPSLVLVTNGHPMSGTEPGSQRYMRAFAHLPLLIEPRLETAMLMCFGVGNTLDALLAHPGVRRVDVVDVSREVLEESGRFSEVNGSPLADPRVRVHVNDARLHLRMQGGERYDLITGEPPPITHAGVVSLYSREFFELARSALRSGGFLTYWLPIYQVGEGAARSVVRAFLDVFPDAVLLSGHSSELLLVGRKDGELVLDPRAVQQRIEADPALRRELRWISLDRASDWVAALAGSPATLRAATRDAMAVTDDRPVLEYANSALSRDRRLPADLFSVEDVEAWCPSCVSSQSSAAERSELAGSLEVIRAYYRSPAFLLPRAGAAFAPALSPEGRRAVARSRYLRMLLGALPAGQRAAAVQVLHGRAEEALRSVEGEVAARPDDPLLRLDLADLLALRGPAAEPPAQPVRGGIR
jgi:spermidine synthase